jgi:hypothetical protein
VLKNICMKNVLLQFLFTWCLLASAHAQLAKTQVVRLQAKANENGSITLSWPAENFSGSFQIYKRLNPIEESWGQALAVIPGNLNEYTDLQAKKGEAWEYQVVKLQGGTPIAFGYIFAGNEWIEPRQFGGVMVLIDSNYILPLQADLAVLIEDLRKESYAVTVMYAGRKESPLLVKNRIEQTYKTSSIKPECLLLIGHIPVPYAGFYSVNGSAPPPDGHIEGSGNHTGAWPADVYYGIFDVTFTDDWVDCSTGAQARNHNIPGDGKWDQTKIDGTVKLEIGRIDLFNMPAFGKSDTLLTSLYLQRNHAYRTAQWKVAERALIDNNFPSLNLASTGYANFASLLGSDSVFDNRDYFTEQKKAGYLWSYGCGAGSYTSCSGIGNTNQFVNDSFENVFTILAGSYFGDWDVQNNFLRAPLASRSLVSFWGGIPKWYVQHMGLGQRIGKGVSLTQNNAGFYFTGNFNSSAKSMHIALMGDPTLTMRNLAPLARLEAISVNKQVKLNWDKVGSNSLYAVYIVDTVQNKYHRLNQFPIQDTFFTDANNHYAGDYVYAVKPIQLESTASGSFYKTGGAAFARVNHVNSITDVGGNSLSCMVYPNPIASNMPLRVSLNLHEQTLVNMQLLDMQGRQLWMNQPVTLAAGKQELYLEKMPVPAGVYLMQIQANQNKAVQKIIVTD